METTVTLESLGESLERLQELEHELKLIHGLRVFLVEPRDADAPVLLSVSILHQGEQAELAIRRIAHAFFEFAHGSAETSTRRKLTLVTIEGENRDLEPLSGEEIRQFIDAAHAGQVG